MPEMVEEMEIHGLEGWEYPFTPDPSPYGGALSLAFYRPLGPRYLIPGAPNTRLPSLQGHPRSCKLGDLSSSYISPLAQSTLSFPHRIIPSVPEQCPSTLQTQGNPLSFALSWLGGSEATRGKPGTIPPPLGQGKAQSAWAGNHQKVSSFVIEDVGDRFVGLEVGVPLGVFHGAPLVPDGIDSFVGC